MSDSDRIEELRRFLKERRARVLPSDVGMPATGRRRVRGLRREEVALLAGIGVSWYTALENGDAGGVSEATLHAVADALRLSHSERQYLTALAAPLPAGVRDAAPAPLTVATMHAISFPAYIIFPTWDVPDCNAAFRRVWAIADGELPFNAVERLFLNPQARAMHGDRFVENIRPVIAMVRSSFGRQPDVAGLKRVRDRVVADETLLPIWNEYEITTPLMPNACTIESPIGTFSYETLTLPVDPSHAIVVQVPASHSSTSRMRTSNDGSPMIQ